MTNYVNFLHKQFNISVWNEKIYGDMQCHDKIKENCVSDKNIHSWHRWRCCKDYFQKIMESNIMVIPPVDKYNAPGGIGIKRVSEALAGGCYVLFHQQPDLNDSTYPIEELCDFSKFKFNDYNDLTQKIFYLINNPNILSEKKEKMYKNAIKYYTSIPITRYFLWNIINSNKEK